MATATSRNFQVTFESESSASYTTVALPFTVYSVENEQDTIITTWEAGIVSDSGETILNIYYRESISGIFDCTYVLRSFDGHILTMDARPDADAFSSALACYRQARGTGRARRAA